MAHKHLHELLEEDQEPFRLNHFIAEKRFNLKRVSPKSHLQVRKRKPISAATSIFPENFCKSACFSSSSFQPSPDFRKSPLFEFHSPAKNSPNAIFLQIPSRTASLLLEAALKIHKQKSSSKKKTTQMKNQGFGLFGSVLKRLTHRTRNTNDESEKLSSFQRRKSSTLSNNGRSSNGFWSESCEERSMDLGTSCSSQSIDFCESPFRFVLQRSPSYGCRTPDFRSPAVSPCHRNKEVEEDEEEDKEQCSPVSVLDTPFDDSYDDDGHDDGDRNGNGDGAYNLECSYATIQRTKQQLLNKLRRFERLADLDPIELEKVMSEEEQDEIDYNHFINEECEDYESVQLDNENDVAMFVKELASDPSFCKSPQILPEDMSKLVADLIAEEEADCSRFEHREEVVQRVCNRLEQWREVEFNTIDMMVEEDLRKEVDEWKKNQEQRGEAAIDVELAIFGLLVEELATELASSDSK